jgi:hypothetical protein
MSNTQKGFQVLVRFVAADEQTYYGDAVLPSASMDPIEATQAKLIEGDIFGSYVVTDNVIVSGV